VKEYPCAFLKIDSLHLKFLIKERIEPTKKTRLQNICPI